MTELKEVKIHLDDIEKAIDLVGGFLNGVQIPGSRASDWSVTGKVLMELKQVIAEQKAKAAKVEVVEEQSAA